MALIVATLLAVVLTPIAARLAVALGVVDQPGALKVHERPVAYLGGVAVFAALAAPVAATRPSLLLPLGLAVALGLADDVVDLPARVRVVGEVGIGVAAVVALPGAHTPLGSAGMVVVVVALLNAVNLLDGLDGLAASVGALAALGFAAVLEAPERSVALAVAGALVGFLVWNRPPARIYLGDAGSYLAGTSLALLFGLVVTTREPVAPAAGALLFVAVPVADTTVAIVRRLRAGRPLLVGDRGHVYDQLVDRGWTAPHTTLTCAGVQGTLVVVGLIVSSLAGPAAVATATAVILVVGGAVLWAFTSPAGWAR